MKERTCNLALLGHQEDVDRGRKYLIPKVVSEINSIGAQNQDDEPGSVESVLEHAYNILEANRTIEEQPQTAELLHPLISGPERYSEYLDIFMGILQARAVWRNLEVNPQSYWTLDKLETDSVKEFHAGSEDNQDNGEEVRERFSKLVGLWKSEIGFTSSIEDMSMQPAYQEIIGMGSEALPFIFDELQHQLDHWFWALRAITGEDPVHESQRGDLHAMREAWLSWARDNGFL